MRLISYKDFHENINNSTWSICPKKKQIIVNGFQHFSLKELQKINFGTRLSFPFEIFFAINEA